MLLGLTTALAQQKPNILVIFGDNVGIMNLSAYHRGMMGGSTPNSTASLGARQIKVRSRARQTGSSGRAVHRSVGYFGTVSGAAIPQNAGLWKSATRFKGEDLVSYLNRTGITRVANDHAPERSLADYRLLRQRRHA